MTIRDTYLFRKSPMLHLFRISLLHNLQEALSYKHLGENVPLGGTGKVLAARAEVGILTRNVKFTGTDNEEWHDKIEACPQGFNTGN